jgi:hypothetical protein
MSFLLRNPLLKPGSLLLVAISLSIGWGIRGDFGHIYGAWIPGALAAMAICLVSERADWRRRVAYCALFGGLGWGFGGSIAYMYTMSYASSGQWRTVWYGNFAMFLAGGLWAGIGGLGIALPLSIDRDRLTRLFSPFCFVLAAIILANLLLVPTARFLAARSGVDMGGPWGGNRHKSPLYWLDTDWFQASWALVGVCAYDFWNRRFAKSLYLVAYGGLGALAGFLVQAGLNLAALTPLVVRWLVVPQGDPTAVNPETGKLFDPENLMTNWPQFFGDYPQHLGWGIGLILGVAVYFYRFGRWRNDAGLFLSMWLGWLLMFLILPVLGSIPLQKYGGLRLTPPRSDDWAGVLGVFVGASLYAVRNKMAPVAFAGALNFILGGIAFPLMHLFRSLILIPGHPDLNWNSGGIPPGWSHYQSANWHSFLEQSQGFAFGIVTCLTMALLWRKLKPVSDDPPVRRWTDAFSVGFVVLFMTYLNVVKNVPEWTKHDHPLMPELMKAPLLKWIELSAETWFDIAWCAMSLAFLALLIVHLHRRLAIVPASWLGRGQIVYVLLLWIMVIANFERSLNGFSEQRLLTEWLIIISASLATFLAIALPGPDRPETAEEPADYGPLIRRVWFRGLVCAAILMTLFAFVNFSIYGKARITGPQYRWGDEAVWRIKPILKSAVHR